MVRRSPGLPRVHRQPEGADVITRRALFGFLAAPAIVPAASLMPVRRPPLVLIERVGRIEIVFKMVDGRRRGDFIRLARAA